MDTVSVPQIVKSVREQNRLLVHLAGRTLELFDENERLKAEVGLLKRELRARRHQADTWRKRYQRSR